MNPAEVKLGVDSEAAWSVDWLEKIKVSKVSQFADHDWYLDNPTHGQGRSTSTIHWSMELGDGSNLLDEHNVSLLFWMKVFIISLFIFPQPGVKVFKPGSARLLFLGLKPLVRWMVDHSLHRLDQLDRVCVGSYIQDLPQIMTQEGDDEESIGIGTAWRSVRTLLLLWKQRNVFLLLGIPAMKERPWSGVSGKKIAREIADRTDGWIPPLPDEVAVPILNRAWWFLSGPHNDILKAKKISDELYSSAMQGDDYSSDFSPHNHRGAMAVAKFLLSFKFSIISGDTVPWFEWVPYKCVHRQFNRLYRSLVSACLVVLQASTGMRASEICGLLASPPDKHGVPGNVRIESSISGNSDMFILESELSKEQPVPRSADWLLGVRVAGDVNYPIPVVALNVLNQVHQGFSSFNGSKFLLSSWVSALVPRSAAGLKRFTNKTLTRSVKTFVKNWVSLDELPDQSRDWVEANDLVLWKKSGGTIIKTHQFRKSFASFALGADSKLLPAIQMQFHHVSVTITESSYWGRFRTQIESIHSAQQQRTALMLYEMATGGSLAAGRQTKVIQDWIVEVKGLIEGKTKSQGWSDIRSFLFERGLVVWFAPHGSCLPLDDMQMQCHKNFGTRPLVGRVPNYKGQQPSVCIGCQCFIVNRSHLGFWENRYLEYSKFLASPHMSDQRSQGVIKARADQALKVVKLISGQA